MMALETREFVVKPQGLKQFGRFESLACIILNEKKVLRNVLKEFHKKTKHSKCPSETLQCLKI